MGDRTEIIDSLELHQELLLDELRMLTTDVPMLQESRDIHAMNAVHFLLSREPNWLGNALGEAQKAHELDVQIQGVLRGEDY